MNDEPQLPAEDGTDRADASDGGSSVAIEVRGPSGQLITSRKWSMEEIDQALMVLAYYGGNAEAARRALAEKEEWIGKIPDSSTLRAWRGRTYAARYIEIATRERPKIEKVALARMQETVLQAQEVQQLGLEAAIYQLKAGEARDPSAVAKNAAIVAGVNVDKLLTVSGRPTVITETHSVDDRIAALKRKRPELFIDSTAEEDE